MAREILEEEEEEEEESPYLRERCKIEIRPGFLRVCGGGVLSNVARRTEEARCKIETRPFVADGRVLPAGHERTRVGSCRLPN